MSSPLENMRFISLDLDASQLGNDIRDSGGD